MTELKINKAKITMFDNIEQLTAERFSKINKYWTLHDELGNSFTDIDRVHLNRMILAVKEPNKLVKLIDNLRVLIYNIINEVNPESLAFACLVHSINGELQNDLSDEGLKRVVKTLSDHGLTNETLKKKLKKSEKQYMKN